MLTVENVKETVLDFLKDTPIGRKMNDERRAAVQAERAAEVKAIAALQARLERELTPLRAAEDHALGQIKEARASLAQAECRWQEKHLVRLSLQFSIESEIARHNGILFKSADPSIDEFTAELRDLAEKTRRTRLESEDVWAYKMGLKTFVGQRTNQAAINTTLKSIQAAIEAAEALRLASCDDLNAEIAKIRAMICPIEPLKPAAPAASARE